MWGSDAEFLIYSSICKVSINKWCPCAKWLVNIDFYLPFPVKISWNKNAETNVRNYISIFFAIYAFNLIQECKFIIFFALVDNCAGIQHTLIYIQHKIYFSLFTAFLGLGCTAKFSLHQPKHPAAVLICDTNQQKRNRITEMWNGCNLCCSDNKYGGRSIQSVKMQTRNECAKFTVSKTLS